MRINAFRCDGCGKEYLIDMLTLMLPDGAPLGWFVVKVAALLNGQAWVFCSRHCLNEWATKSTKECQTVTARFEYEGKMYAGTMHEVIDETGINQM